MISVARAMYYCIRYLDETSDEWLLWQVCRSGWADTKTFTSKRLFCHCPSTTQFKKDMVDSNERKNSFYSIGIYYIYT